jgi:hypothetical protein
MTTETVLTDAPSDRDFDSVRARYISAMNTAVAAGRDDLVIALSEEYEAEFPSQTVSEM